MKSKVAILQSSALEGEVEDRSAISNTRTSLCGATALFFVT
jgi:hypothetical protein